MAKKKLFYTRIDLGIPREFVEFCKFYEVTTEKVLHAFIADLLEIVPCSSDQRRRGREDGLGCGGSDEHMMARDYFDRTYIAGVRHMKLNQEDEAEAWEHELDDLGVNQSAEKYLEMLEKAPSISSSKKALVEHVQQIMSA